MAQLVVHLRDVSSGSPIPFTAIFVGTTAALSDINGNATLDLNPGTYTITVRSPAYVAVPGAVTSVTVPSEVTIQLARVTL
jgi:uncharacterized membrane protein